MKHIKRFYESIDSNRILSIKVTTTNAENINPEKLPDCDWIDSESWVRECLSDLLKDSDNRSIIKEGDILCIGTGMYDFSLVEINSIEPLDFKMDRSRLFPLVREKYKKPSNVFSNPDIKFTFNNKYNYLKLFAEKYPDLYKKLNTRYNAIERGGNMVDFKGDWVVYTEWDFEDESGSEYKLCKIDDLSKDV